MFPHINVSHFPIYRSDYAPIMFNTTMVHDRKGDMQFRFESMWLARNDCRVVVEKVWNEHPSANIVRRITSCSQHLSYWA